MAITVVGVSKGTANGAAVTVAPPTGYAAGDYFYAVQFEDNDGTVAEMGSVTGWTVVSSATNSPNTGPGQGRLMYKVATASESSYTFPMSSNSENTVQIIALRGVDTTTPLAASPVWSIVPKAATTSLVAPSVSPSAAGTLITFHSLMLAGSGATMTAPTGMTGNGSYLGYSFYAMTLLSTQMVPSGATGTKTATSSTSGNTNIQGYLTMSFVAKAASNSATGTLTGAGTGAASITGASAASGALSGAATGGASITGINGRRGSLTGAGTGSASIDGISGYVGSLTGDGYGDASITGEISLDLHGDLFGEGFGSASIEGTNQPVGQLLGEGWGAADIRGGIGLYFRTPAYKQHPRDRHPLIARTYIAVGITLLKFGNSYRTYIDTDPELITQADKVYLGGHLYFVDFSEGEELKNAGYGQLLSVDIPSSSDDNFQLVDYSQYGAGIFGTGPFGA